MSQMRPFEEIGGLNKENDANLKNVKNNRDPWKNLVHQYVINISFESSMTAWLKKISMTEQLSQQDGKNECMT
jgi:hypothetical protein